MASSRLINWFGIMVAANRLPIEFRGQFASAGSPTKIKVFQEGRITVGIGSNYRPTGQVEDGRREEAVGLAFDQCCCSGDVGMRRKFRTPAVPGQI
jgi:hypothetical protein